MLGDGKTAYDNDNDGKDQELGGCSSEFRDKDYPTKAKIRYIKNTSLQVSTYTFYF
jgi:lectin, mannose-binding 2